MDIVIAANHLPLQPNTAINAMHGIEKVMFGLDQVTPDVEHYVGTGTYGRVMIIDPDVMVSGRMHKGSTITIVLSGNVQMHSNHGVFEELSAGDVRVTPPRTKRLWYSPNGAKLMTIHAIPEGQELTPDELEQHILVPIEEEAL